MKRHYSSKYFAQYNLLTGQLKKDKIKKLITDLGNQQQMLHSQRSNLDSVVKANIIISSKIAKTSKSFSGGQFVKECLVNVAELLCPEKKKEFEKVSLSQRTVARRIDMMASNIKKALTDGLTGFQAFSIRSDESTDLSDTAELVIFIRGVDGEFAVTEELLVLRTLQGKDIFTEVQCGLQWCKLVGVYTDGAPSMVGSQKVLSEFRKERATAMNVQ